jgi:hypothetical protein
MAPDTPSDIRLAAGESLHLPVAAGSVLFVARGRVRIDASPRWLADRMVPVGATAEEGQPYTVEQAGWIRVTVLGGAGAQLRPVPVAVPASRAAPWWRFMRQWLGA